VRLAVRLSIFSLLIWQLINLASSTKQYGIVQHPRTPEPLTGWPNSCASNMVCYAIQILLRSRYVAGTIFQSKVGIYMERCASQDPQVVTLYKETINCNGQTFI
jgi:hypothetical protein